MRRGDGNQLASLFLVPSSRHVACKHYLSRRNSMRQCATLACQLFTSQRSKISGSRPLGRGMEQPTAKLRKREAVGNPRELADEPGLS